MLPAAIAGQTGAAVQAATKVGVAMTSGFRNGLAGARELGTHLYKVVQIQQIAGQITSVHPVAAMRRMAAAAAIAAPIAMLPATGAYAAARRAVPATSLGIAAPLRRSPGATASRSGEVHIHVSYSPTINIAKVESEVDFKKVIDQNKHELLDAIQDELAKQERTRF